MNGPVIFLDIDGVLNSTAFFKDHPQDHLDPEACARLQAVCDYTGAVLVVSSTWRMFVPPESLGAMFAKAGIVAPIVGYTPTLISSGRYGEPMPGSRGLEIQWWIRHYIGDSQGDLKFVCIDDEGENAYGDLVYKLVQTRSSTGLTDSEIPYIEKKLSETLEESKACGFPGDPVEWNPDVKILCSDPDDGKDPEWRVAENSQHFFKPPS